MTALLAGLLAAGRASHDLAPSLLLLSLSLPYEMFRLVLLRRLEHYFALRNPRRILIVGSGRRASTAWRAIRVHDQKEVTLLGFVDNRNPAEMAPDVASRYLGSIDRMNELLLREVVDTILIAMPAKSCYGLIQQAIDQAEQVGATVVYMNDVFTTSQRQHAAAPGEIFEQLVPPREHFVLRHGFKRAMDILGAMAGLIVAAPVMAAIAVAIKLTSPGDIFFRQERCGYRRRRFRMIKFRSMVQDAPALMSALESRNEASGPIFKIKDDPRVTPLGRILRATSLDELPQLWNVLMGEMSLVGPRPMSIRDVTLFSDAALMRRFSVKPGLTGLWQVSGRSSVSFEQWMAYDFHYIDRWSLTLDMKILIWTLSAVMKRSGAM
jgi:exopolysaccharide biosynthesis polyprenyl glycosylphosphotransferase